MNIEQVKDAIAQIKNQFSKLNIGGTMGIKTSGIFGDLEKEIEKFQSLSSKKIGTEKSFKPLEESGRRIIQLYGQLENSIRNVSGLSKKQMESLFPSSVKSNIEKATTALSEYEKKTKQSSQEIKKLEAESKKLKNTLDNLNNKKNTLLGKNVKDDASATQKAAAALKGYQAAQEQVAQKQQDIEKARKGHKAVTPLREEKAQLEAIANDLKAKYEKLAEARDKIFTQTKKDEALSQLANQIKEAEGNFNTLNASLSNLKANNQQAFSNLIASLNQIKGINLDPTTATIDQVKVAISGLTESEFSRLFNGLKNVEGSFNSAQGSIQQFENQIDTAKTKVSQMDERLNQVNMLKNRITYFFGLTNQIMLFRRAVTQAMTAVKELDAAMTEIAVVTDFSIGDMWEKLPEYTRRANELGVAVKDLYAATGLYYQQGLKGNKVMELGVETMKMARIAGMDAADATKAMTAAIRGFNLEIDEMSGKRVNDVYSQLAAMTASDTEGIATAMSKTASIAYSANMELETTAALLAQIIETTQESPETAGTAMKTIIARFTEVKELFSEGQLTGKDTEGEEININRIDAALKTVGISLKDFLNGSKGIDDIFLELAQKWDTLDLATQRYIATAAAGSRQQSRFIAMMQDYDRTMELVTAANNSAGASQNQYEKTLESMETLLTKLKNAWQEFLTGIANNEVLKFGVKAITGILNVVNKLTGSLPGLIGSFAKLGLAWGALKLGGSLLTKGLGTLVNNITTSGNNKKTVQTATLISTKNGVEQGTEAGTVKGLKDIGPWIKTKWAQFVADGIMLGNKEAEVKTASMYRTKWLKQETDKATNKRMAASNLRPGTIEYEAERKKIQREEWKRISKESKAADMKLESAFIDKSNVDLNAASSKMELENAYKDAIATEVEATAAKTEASTVAVEVSSDIMENEAARNELLASLSERSGGKNIQLVSNSNLGQTQFRVSGGTSTGGAVKNNLLNKLGVGKGGGKWSFGSMAGGAIAGAIAGGLAGNWIGGQFASSNSSLEEQAGDLKVSLEGINSTISSITENLDGLDDAKKNFAELNKTLKETSKGSSEYTQALIKNNQAFFELNDDFNFLSNEGYYEKDAATGAYTITDLGWQAYERDQTRKLEEANLLRLQSQAVQSQVDMIQAGIGFADSIGKGTSEITAKEEENIKTTATITGAATGGIAGGIAAGIAAGAAAGSLGGPIGLAIGAAAGLVFGALGALIGGGVAQGVYGSGLSADTYNEVALRAGKAGLADAMQYSGADYNAFLQDVSGDLGIAVEDLKTIIETDKDAFAEHVAAITKANAQILAIAEQTAIAQAEQMGLTGDAKQAYVEAYKATVGEDNLSEEIAARQEEILSDGIAKEKQARKDQTWNQIARDDEERQLAYDYAKLMGYIINENDNEEWLLDATGQVIQEIPTLAEMAYEVAKNQIYDEKRQGVSELGLNVAEAQALGLKRGTANIGGFTLGSLQDTYKALNNVDVMKLDWIENIEDREMMKTIWGDNEKGLRGEINGILAGNLENIFGDISQNLIGATTAEVLASTKNTLNGLEGGTIGWEIQQELDRIYKGTAGNVSDYDLNELFLLFQNTDVESDTIARWISETLSKSIINEDTKTYLQEETQLYEDLQAITAPFKEYLGEALEDLTVNEAEALKGQFDLIGDAMTDQVTSLMTDAAKALQESDSMDFEEILSLGLDPQAIYDYVSSMEEQNRITKEGADTLREYANSLADLNLGFDTISLTTLSEQIAGVQKYQNKISELELGEKLVVSQEEVDEMIKLGLADAEDFWKTSEGFEYLGGSLDELNNTAEKILERLGGRIESTAEGQQRRKEIWNSQTGKDFRDSYNEETRAYEWVSWTANEQDSEDIKEIWTSKEGNELRVYYDRMTKHLSTDEQEKLGVKDWDNLTETDYNKLAEAAYDAGDFAIAAAIEQIKNDATNEDGTFKFSQTSNYQSYSKGISAETLASGDASQWSQEEMEYFFNEFKDTGLFTYEEIYQAEQEGIRSIGGIIANEAKLLAESGAYDPQSANWNKQTTVRSAGNEQLLGYIQSGEYVNPDTGENYAQTELNRRFEGLYGFDENSEEFERMFKDAYGQSMEEAGDSAKYLSNMLKSHKLAASDSRKAAEKLGKAVADNSDEFKGATSRLKDQEVTLEQLTEGQREAYDVIKAYAEDAFGMEFNRDFIVNNADLFLQLAEGGEVAEEAFYKIGAAAAEARLKAEGVADAGNVVQTVITQLDGLTFGIDGTADFSQVFATLFAVLQDAEKVKEVLGSMGYEIEFEPTKITRSPVQDHYLNESLAKQGWIWTGLSGGYNQWIKPGKAIGTKSGDSTVSSSGGGGGGGSSSEWENPYDESYNTLRAINAELRERDRLEREYQHLLDKEGTSWKELLSNSYEFINNRREEAALQEQLQQERRSQIESLVNENSKYSSYVTVDMNAGDFTIDWAAIEGLEGENLSEEEEAFRQGLEDYISALEDKFDSLYDAEEAAAEALDDIRDYVADLQDEYLNAETMIKDAIVSSYQEQIDKLSEINDSINDANSKLLDAVQSSIDQMRQDRENEKTEQELSDKERRLAYLRQDTSGANALEILELEKELKEGRQDYTDSLVDQKISQLQDQNDYAAEQRQQQIDIMTSQLEWFQESGEIFSLVSNLMEGMYDENGKIDQTSVGWRLLESQADAMSEVGHMKWMEETESLLTQALVYLSLNGYNGNMAYSASTDYMAAMANTTSESALAQLEQYRNYKIASQGRTEGMTYDYQDVSESEFDAFLKELGYNSLSDYITKFLVGQKGYEAYNSNTDYMAKMIAAVEAGDYVAAAVAEVYRNRKIEDLGLDIPKTYAFQKYLPKYKTGGIADFTGPAWLDGTKSRPEMVLNQRDTQNFIQLKDILSGLLGHGNFNSSETNGDVYYNIDINVERISSDYDIDEVVNKIKQTIYEDASYRNVNAIHLIR